MSIPSYSQIVRKEIHSRMKEMGFKLKKYSYIYSDDEDSCLTIGFPGIHSYGPEYIMSIFVGVSINSVKTLFCKLTETIYNPEAFIIGTQIGYIMPEHNYKEWCMNREKPCNPWVNDMIDAIQKYAFPYYEKMKDFDTMLDEIESGKNVQHSIRDYYYPVMLYQAGRKEEGLRHIERILNSERYIKDELKRYIQFANNYKKLLHPEA